MNLIQIETTNVCNLHCPFCYREFMTREQGFMNFCTFRKSLKLAHKLKVKEVWLHNFGEPLLHPQLTKFIKHASRNFKVGFATNGTLLNFQKIRELKSNGLTYLDISLNMDTQKFNLVHYIAMYQIANELGLDCRFRTVVNNKGEYDYLHKMLKSFKVRWQRTMIRSKEVRTSPCEAKKKVCVVLWDGTVVPCCSIVNKEIIYGEINNTNIQEKIRNGIASLDNRFNRGYCKFCGEVEEEMPIERKL